MQEIDRCSHNLLGVVCAWCALMVLGCTTDSLLWQRFREKDFPARVKVVLTHLGDVLDAQHKLTYDSWTIGFGKDRPYASYRCPQDAMCRIIVSGLRCESPTSGGTNCEMILYYNATCKLVIPESHEAFLIRCPLDLSLEPRKSGDKDKSENAPSKSSERQGPLRYAYSLPNQ